MAFFYCPIGAQDSQVTLFPLSKRRSNIVVSYSPSFIRSSDFIGGFFHDPIKAQML